MVSLFETRIKIEVAWQLFLTMELIRANESDCSWNMQFLQERLATCYSLGLFTLGSDSREMLVPGILSRSFACVS